jgi:hypothetical protein
VKNATFDYGVGRMAHDPIAGTYRRTRLFVMMLGYSRKSVRCWYIVPSCRSGAELHEKSFAWLTGATRMVVLDNHGVA